MRAYSTQKAALTRAIRSGDPDKVIAECTRTVREWDDRHVEGGGPWPDDWSRWQRALDDIGSRPPWHRILLEDLT